MSSVDLNMAQCLRDVSRFGYNEIHNVCTGAVTTVPWGILEWFGVAILLSIPITITLFYVWLNYPKWAWQRRMRLEGRL
ncbi:hypothetical protein [Agrobacterium tumefaciens]|uniref:hypothetical protein n=1 Tax=Agrobacterium tumefaciens TaxID=358 RepID=UPI0021CFEA0C|nr:hypothetical protein [Agrobacterium tumefaciens]UXS01676.1 hypothetical protein FY156_09455 [Agrobacterium tumefaciens]